MMDRPRKNDATNTEAPSGPSPRVLVYWQGGVASAPLVPGTLVLGRAETADVRIDHASVSRNHAILSVVASGPDELELRIEDLDSSNGTRKNGQRLPPRVAVAFALGDAIEVGSATLVVAGVRGASDTGAPSRATGSRMTPIVCNATMIALYELVADVARSKLGILVLGETGVGKEIVAEAIHRASSRKDGPFVRLNTAAIPESLFESTLFGHERGAFTGAQQSRPGLLEAADQGTLFLDEIGDLPLMVQAKLLRVLENGEVSRLGAPRARSVDVRFVSATNRDLGALVAAGAFRQDLYYRLNGVTLDVPPLRARRDEIEPLVRAFVSEVCSARGTPEVEVTPEAMEALRAHGWPGNVRELRQVVERGVLVSRGGPVTIAHLALERGLVRTEAGPEAPTMPPPPHDAGGLRSSVETFERQRILEALEQTGGNQTEAAKLLGIARRTLVSRIDVYGLPRPRKGPPKA